MIPLAMPNLTGNEKKYLNNCIDTTYVSSVGEYVMRLEKMVAEETGSVDAVATSSGTTGLHAALTALGVKHGDLVILPSFTFIASANSVKHCGADPWFFDIDPETWCINVEQVAASLNCECERRNGQIIHIQRNRRVAAIMPVYTLGNLPDMTKLHMIAAEYGIPIIADAACAIGATFGENKQAIGELADLSVLSFNGNKTITCGGGGAVIGSDKEKLDYVRHLTTTARVWPDYIFDEVGFNYRMTNIQAAVGVAQMERLESFVEKKKFIRSYYSKSLADLQESNGISFFPTTNGSACWFSGIVLPEGQGVEKAKKICTSLKNQDIEAKPFWKPVHLQTPYFDEPIAASISDTFNTSAGHLEKKIKDKMTVSDNLWSRIITLPCSTNITDEELEIVGRAVTEVIKSC